MKCTSNASHFRLNIKRIAWAITSLGRYSPIFEIHGILAGLFFSSTFVVMVSIRELFEWDYFYSASAKVMVLASETIWLPKMKCYTSNAKTESTWCGFNAHISMKYYKWIRSCCVKVILLFDNQLYSLLSYDTACDVEKPESVEWKQNQRTHKYLRPARKWSYKRKRH